MTRDELLKAALALSADDRAILLDRLIASLSTPAAPEHEQAWLEEFRRRLQAFDRGEVELIDADEVLDRHRDRKSA